MQHKVDAERDEIDDREEEEYKLDDTKNKIYSPKS